DPPCLNGLLLFRRIGRTSADKTTVCGRTLAVFFLWLVEQLFPLNKAGSRKPGIARKSVRGYLHAASATPHRAG
ncbi:TPA: hypothetical protein ACFNMY_002114, partial [Neisseria bacilliformis]